MCGVIIVVWIDFYIYPWGVGWNRQAFFLLPQGLEFEPSHGHLHDKVIVSSVSKVVGSADGFNFYLGLIKWARGILGYQKIWTGFYI